MTRGVGETQSTSDKFRWICMNKCCNTYKTSTSIRNGSFFSGFKSSFRDLCTVIYCWFLDKTSKDHLLVAEIKNDFVLCNCW